MDSRISKIKVGSYVSLKDGFDPAEYYRGASAGATGWVREADVDEYGFPMVLIEWDVRNPNWSGEMDRWTFESHFRTLNDGTDIDADADYIDALRDASDQALAGMGFLMMIAKEVNTPDGPTLDMDVHIATLDPFAQEAFEQYILDTAEEIMARPDENDLEF